MYAKSSSYNGGLGAMPLRTHLDDTAWFAERICRDWLGDSALNTMAKLAGGTVDDVVRTTVFLAAAHDIAKDSPAYVEWFSSDKPRPAMESECHHDFMGEYVLAQWLEERGYPTGWASVVGSHHGWTSDTSVEDDPYFGIEEMLGDDAQCARRSALLDDLFSSHKPRLDMTPDPHVLMLMAGVTVMADWKASALWPTIGDHTAARELPLDLPTLKVEEQSFAEMFGQQPRPFQTALAEMATTEAALYLVNAPTGDGKGKAAVYLAALLVSRMGLTGMMFAMPTRVTANFIYEQLMHDWAKQMSALVWLAHGSARQNPLYMSQNNAHGTRHHLRMLAPVVLGTVDQVLLSFVRDKHQMLRHLGLVGKVLIVDEVHSYDPHMSRLLDEALRWLASYGVPVILLSATLPPSRRRELVRAYTGRDEEVPAATIVRATATETVTHTSQSVREPVTSSVSMASGRIGPTLRAVREGGNVLVICNTVRAAVKTARELRQHLDDVTLLHSRYTNADRNKREKAVLERFGSEATERPSGAVLVTTQLVEQSADIDFDVLVTDLCPTDRIIQRFGRVYRNRSVERRVPPAIHIVQTNDVWLYSSWVLEQTRDVWSPLSSVTLPTDSEVLLIATYEVDRHPKLLTEHRNGVAGLHQRAVGKMLRPRGNTITGMFPKTSDDLAVRDGSESVTVVPVVEGRLIDGSDPSDETRWAENSVGVPASWRWTEGLVDIDPSQYSEDGLSQHVE